MIYLKKLKLLLFGGLMGVVNGLFGAGGGLITVPLLNSLDIPPKRAHATSVAIILPLSVISAISLFFSGVSLLYDIAVAVIPTGILGALLGAYALKKIGGNTIRIIFAAVMIISAIRILFK